MIYKKSEIEDKESQNMQILTRQVLTNVLKNGLKTKTPLRLAASQLNQQAQQPPRSHVASVAPQQNLLRFPAFPLQNTLDLFLRTCEPLLTSEEMECTTQAVKHFNATEGAKLQAYLEAVAQKEDNWLATRWLRTAYMQYRDPVTIFSSPGMTFPLRQPFECDEELADYAAKLIFNLVKYKQLVDEGKIPIVKMGKQELDNSQFGKVFGTCRIPALPEDCLKFYPESRHVVVIHKNYFYKLPVYDDKCEPLHISVLMKEILKIIESETQLGPKLGLLTTDKRDNWAKAYADLIENEQNNSSIGEIQKALFTVSIDSYVPYEDSNVYSVFSEQLIHGGGAAQNSANRWMDKTIQLVINPNGCSGFTYEHSPAEGQPIALITDYVVKNLKDDKFYECGSKGVCEGAKKLCLSPSDSSERFICQAEQNLTELVYDFQTVTLQYKKYGKGFLKKQKLSPDSFIQMAQQLAFYTMHQVPAAHYESAHLRIYKGGRTETIRSCSKQSVEFAKAMCDINCGNQQKYELLKKAVNSHRQYTNLALQGKGVDRHLLGLKLMAIENKLPIPGFYKSAGYVKSAYFRLSTSQVASVNPVYMCYGPLVQDGYGCCYNPREDDIWFSISAWRSCTVTDADMFAGAMTDALDLMHDLLLACGEQTKAKL